MTAQFGAQDKPFRVEEATIEELHQAIRGGRPASRSCSNTSSACAPITASRACSSPKTARRSRSDGHRARDRRRCASRRRPSRRPTLLPDLDKYQGPPLEFGRMEATASDPARAAAVRHDRRHAERRAGECARDAQHPRRALRHLPRRLRPASVRRAAAARRAAGVRDVPALPDALEQAAELDATYGRNPDLEKMPMYGVVFSFKDPFDTKDMRTTGGGDARYDIDFPARDHVLVEQLRKKGAIIFAKAVNTEYNGRAGDPGGRHKPDKVLPSVLGYQRSTWAGNPSNPYDTTRAASLGSSSGSGVSVSTNLVMASLGEETRASCRGPANHNAVALILPHKAMLGFDGGAIGADIYCDRSGILCRTIADCAKVLDALKDPVDGYYDPRDPYTTVPRSSVLSTPYASHAKMSGRPGALKGMRIGIVRESMLNPGTKAAEPITTAAAQEIKTILGGQLGATLVESSDPLWKPDPDIEPMKTDFRRALARLVPVFMPDLLFRLGRTDSRSSRSSRRRSCRPSSRPARSSARGTHAADRLHGRAGGRTDRAAREPRHLDRPGAGARDVVPLPHPAIPDAPRRGLAGARVHRDAGRLADAQRAFQILGRRSARRLQELGRGDRPAQSAGRAPGRRRAHHAARTAAPGGHDGDHRESSRRAGAPAYAVAAGEDRRRRAAGHSAQSATGDRSTGRTRA